MTGSILSLSPCMVQVLDAYENTQEEEPASEAYERSELLLYKASVLAEGGKHAEALSLLDSNQVHIRPILFHTDEHVLKYPNFVMSCSIISTAPQATVSRALSCSQAAGSAGVLDLVAALLHVKTVKMARTNRDCLLLPNRRRSWTRLVRWRFGRSCCWTWGADMRRQSCTGADAGPHGVACLPGICTAGSGIMAASLSAPVSRCTTPLMVTEQLHASRTCTSHLLPTCTFLPVQGAAGSEPGQLPDSHSAAAGGQHAG